MHAIISHQGLIRCPYMAYVLGFLWGDGTLFKHNLWSSRGVACEVAYQDFVHLVPIFQKTGQWKTFVRTRYGKQYGRIYMTHRDGYDYLERLGYKTKHLSHRRAMEKIAEEVQHCFVLGLFDADGNIFAQSGGTESQTCICGPFNQQWGFLKRWLKQRGIPTRVSKHFNKGRSAGWSYLHQGGVWFTPVLKDILYSNTPSNLPLLRKREIFEMVVSYLRRRYREGGNTPKCGKACQGMIKRFAEGDDAAFGSLREALL